ncbi:hypothetical protein BH18ACT1_BH18ACT1_14910 [soil metagenome]
MRRLLRVPPPGSHAAGQAAARRAFSTSMAVSALRCLLTYVVLPFVAPAVGLAAGVGPALGLLIGAVAIASNVASARRFWLAEHPRRWAFTAVAAAVIVLVSVLMLQDLTELLS